MTERTTNDLNTPEWLWSKIIGALGYIALDPCSNEWSTVPSACRYDGVHVDGLTAPWGSGPVFVNPPYGRGHLRPWASKVVAEAANGCEIVLLVPCSPDTAWWQSCLHSVRCIAYLNKRVAFGGGKHGSGEFASALLYFGPRPYAFAHEFANVADIRLMGGHTPPLFTEGR